MSKPGIIESEKRGLVAVMFAEIANYFAIVNQDEHQLKRVQSSFIHLIKEVVQKFGGELIQNYGEGVLLTFQSSIHAMGAAKELQQLSLLEKKLSQNIKVGMHIGDILYDEGGVLGDSVNVSARLGALGVGGSIIFSEKVYDDIKNQGGFTPVFLGEFELKNVSEPIKVFALGNEGLILPRYDQIRAQRSNFINSIAVLPFLDINEASEDSFLSDGITDEIINSLSKIEGLKVTSRTSSFAFKGKFNDVRVIGKELGVGSILEGTVQRAGDRIKVSARLYNTSDGYQVWSDSFNGMMTDVFELQDQIAEKISRQLKANFTARKKHLKAAPTQNIEAYNLYLEARYYWNNGSVPELKRAISLFRECLELEPNFSQAWSGLATANAYLGAYGQMPPNEVYPEAKKAALKALDLDHRLAESQIALAFVEFFYELDWVKAGISFERALELNPGSAQAHHTYSWYLSAMRRHNEAINEINIALHLDPLSPSIATYLAEAYFYAENYEAALEQYNRVLERYPNHKRALEFKARILSTNGDLEGAYEVWKKIKSLSLEPNHGISGFGIYYGEIGDKEKALEIIKKVEEREKNEPGISFSNDYAFIYTAMGEYEKALDALESSFEIRSGVFTISLHPIFDPIRDHPRFKKLMDQIRREPEYYFSESGTATLEEEDTVVLKSEINESLKLKKGSIIYIEAEGNYSKIVWEENGKARSKLLRIVIKKLESQLINPFLIRCHRSFIVNLNKDFEVLGNARGYRLKHKLLEKEIPISRSKGSEIVSLLNG
ncbi:MAG: tetratricopeptide repeat protein [Balneola sp.]|nr:MAG: tetratricopeptide repeat protein [Balneola sp.]